MKQTQRSGIFLTLLILAIVALGYGVFTNVVSDIWGQDIQQIFQERKWLIVVLAVVLIFLGLWYSERSKKNEKVAAETVDADQYENALRDFRAELIDQYQTRLHNKTSDRLPINLAAKPTNFGTSEARAKLYFDKTTIESDDIANEIGKILDTVQRLLIIGEPGAGKTTIVLYAALSLLRDEKNLKLPIMLNLATWESNRDFGAWYVQNIAQSYGLSAVFANALMERNVVVPFFDGFDEVAKDHRVDCLEKMKAYFGDQRNRQLIICSRKKEFAEAKADAPVYYELEVQPLSLEQIKKSLTENAPSQAADRALLDALDQDKWLCKAVETPFYLNTASFLFGQGERAWGDFEFKMENTEGRRREILERFVEEQVPDQQDQRFLHILANRMEVDRFLVFELTKMQPGWSKSVRRYQFVVSLLLALSLGLVLGIFCGLLVGIGGNLAARQVIKLGNALGVGLRDAGLVFGLALGLILGFIQGFASNKIDTLEVQTWSWQELKKNWKLVLALTLVVGLFIGSFITLLGGLTFGLVIGVIGSVTVGFLFGRLEGIKTSYLLTILSPYQRFIATFQSALWNIISFFILFVVTGGIGRAVFVEGWGRLEFIKFLQSELFWYQVMVFIPLLLTWLIMESQILAHFSLRLVLYFEHKIPLRLVTFLDRMSDQRILEDNRRIMKGKKRRGASWRFRHKILQDYFAKLD